MVNTLENVFCTKTIIPPPPSKINWTLAFQRAWSVFLSFLRHKRNLVMKVGTHISSNAAHVSTTHAHTLIYIIYFLWKYFFFQVCWNTNNLVHGTATLKIFKIRVKGFTKYTLYVLLFKKGIINSRSAIYKKIKMLALWLEKVIIFVLIIEWLHLHKSKTSQVLHKWWPIFWLF